MSEQATKIFLGFAKKNLIKTFQVVLYLFKKIPEFILKSALY